MIFGYLMAQNQQAIPSISIPLHTVIELTPRPDGTMGIDYIPVNVSLSDASSMVPSSMDALPAGAAAAVAAAGSGSSGGSSSTTVTAVSPAAGLVPLSPGMSPAALGLGLDAVAAVAAVGACPFKQDEQQGPAAAVAAAAMQRGSPAAAGADAAVLIGDSGEHSSSSTGTGCALQAQPGPELLQHAESLPCYYYVEAQDDVSQLPLLHQHEIQRMSSCSSGSSLALMQSFSDRTNSTTPAPATAVAPAGCVEQ